jgi:hypothetical protein
MHEFMRFALPSGHLYEIPIRAVADHRAEHFHKANPDEFPTLDAAREDSMGLFADDARAAREWLLGNMDEAEVRRLARLVDYKPPVLEWSIADVTYHGTRADVAQPKAEDVLQVPVEMIVSFMAATNELCAAQQVVDAETGHPTGALVFVSGGHAVVQHYLRGLQIITDQVLAAMEAANKAAVVAGVQH